MAGEKILVVDPDTTFLKTVVEPALSPHGFQLLLTSDQDEAAEIVAAEGPCLLLLRFPMESTTQLLRRLAQEEQQISSVLIVEQEGQPIPLELVRLGVRDYVSHSSASKEVLRTVCQVLEYDVYSPTPSTLLENRVVHNRDMEDRVNETDVLLGIGRSISSLLDLESVLNRIIEAAIFITGAEEGYLLLRDEVTGELRLRAAKNLGEKLAQDLSLQVDDSIAGTVVRSGKPMLLSGNGTPSVKVKTGYLVKSLLNVPLKVNAQTIGVLGVDNRVSNAHFSLSHVRRLSALADMAAVAIENARRYTELNKKLARRGQEIATLQAMAGQLSDITDFRVGARLVLSLALKATNAEAGVLAWTIGDDGLPIYYVSQGSPGGLLVARHNERVPARWWDERTLHAAIRTGETVLEAGLDSERNGHNAWSRSRLAAPLRRNGKVIGAIHLESSMPYAFSQEDVQFVSSVSDQVALALEGKALYERAETERERWSILMEAVDNAVWVVDADLRLLAQNVAAGKMLGWSSAEAVGCSICELMSSSHSAESLCQLLSQVIETRQSVAFPSQDSLGGRLLLLRTKDSQAVPITGRAVPLVRDGRVVGAICAFRQVLDETDKGLVRLEFSNMASHLLRSPLSFIQAGVDLLLNGDLNGEEQGVVLHKMREQSQRMRDFIKDLLELARLESGSVDIYPEPVVLPPMIKRVLSLVQTEEADYEFSFRIPGEFPIVAADPGKLELILLALLHSAMNRCPGGGHIDIELETHETEALISIQDNGEVIPAKQLERMFSQFYPVDDDNDKMPSTYQIGLYATKRLIELQNGRVWAESQPGKGTRFGFSLPFWG